MFSFFFATAATAYTAKQLYEAKVLPENKKLLEDSKKLALQATEDDPLINQIVKLLTIHQLEIACNIIAEELKKENDASQLSKIIQLINKIQQEVNGQRRAGDLSYDAHFSIIKRLNVWRQEAITKGGQESFSIPVPGIPHSRAGYGASQEKTSSSFKKR